MFNTAIEEDLEIIDEESKFFIGRSAQWRGYPDDTLCLGYKSQHNKLIYPLEYFEQIEQSDSDVYYDSGYGCSRDICVADGRLKSNQEDTPSLDWCPNCHDLAVDMWSSLIKRNSELGVSHLL